MIPNTLSSAAVQERNDTTDTLVGGGDTNGSNEAGGPRLAGVRSVQAEYTVRSQNTGFSDFKDAKKRDEDTSVLLRSITSTPISLEQCGLNIQNRQDVNGT